MIAMTEFELAQLVEMSEARAYLSLITSAPEDVSETYGFRAHRVGTAVAVMADSVGTSLNLNRIIGLGINEPLTEVALDRQIECYENSGVRFGIVLSPTAQPSDIPSWFNDVVKVPHRAGAGLAQCVSITWPPPDTDGEQHRAREPSAIRRHLRDGHGAPDVGV